MYNDNAWSASTVSAANVRVLKLQTANVRSVIQIKVNLALTDRRANERRYTNTRNVLIGTQSICKLASIARGFPLKSKV